MNLPFAALMICILLLANKSVQINLQSMLIALSYYRIALRKNHKLHMQVACKLSILALVLESSLIVATIIFVYILAWMANPFSMPLIVSVFVAILIGFTPIPVGAPMLIYLKRYPPEKWMSSRIDRLSRPF